MTVYLDETLVSWGKQQEGGLSNLMRQLLANARDEKADAPADYPLELRAAYNRLINAKLGVGLSPEQERELADVRARINQFDRESSIGAMCERAALVVDEELARLRREIEALPPRL